MYDTSFYNELKSNWDLSQTLREESDFVEVAKTGEIELGKMKSVDVKGMDVLIANVDG